MSDVEDETPDDQYADIVKQIDSEDKVDALYEELKSYTEYSVVPLLDKLNIGSLSEFLFPTGTKVY